MISRRCHTALHQTFRIQANTQQHPALPSQTCLERLVAALRATKNNQPLIALSSISRINQVQFLTMSPYLETVIAVKWEFEQGACLPLVKSRHIPRQQRMLTWTVVRDYRPFQLLLQQICQPKSLVWFFVVLLQFWLFNK